MKTKNKILYFFIVISFIYSFCVFFDYILFRIAFKNYIKIRQVEREVFFNNLTLASLAKKEGYEPFIYPFLFDRGNVYEKYYEKNKALPLGGQPNKNVYICDEGYGLIKFKTDQLGYRNKNDIWINENYKNGILIIGDSIAAGHCLNYEDTIAAKLENKIKVVNISAAGNDSVMYEILAKTFIKNVNPKIVLTIFTSNDNSLLSNVSIQNQLNTFFLTNFSVNDYLKYNSENKSLNLNSGTIKLFEDVRANEFFSGPIDQIQKYSNSKNILLRILKYSTLPTIRSISKTIYYKYNFSLPEPSKLAINNIIDECKKYNCRPIFAYIPQSDYWRSNPLNEPFRESLKNYVVNEKKSDFFDLGDYFQGNTYDNLQYYSPKGGHLSPLGTDIFFNNFYKKYNKYFLL